MEKAKYNWLQRQVIKSVKRHIERLQEHFEKEVEKFGDKIDANDAAFSIDACKHLLETFDSFFEEKDGAGNYIKVGFDYRFIAGVLFGAICAGAQAKIEINSILANQQTEQLNNFMENMSIEDMPES